MDDVLVRWLVNEKTNTPKEWEDALARHGLTPEFVENVRQEVVANGKQRGCTCEPFVHLLVDPKQRTLGSTVTHKGKCPLNRPANTVALLELDDKGRQVLDG